MRSNLMLVSLQNLCDFTHPIEIQRSLLCLILYYSKWAYRKIPIRIKILPSGIKHPKPQKKKRLFGFRPLQFSEF
jgi:hypothetical protein